MKKVFVVMLMAMAFAMPSNAQIKFGITGGLNLSNVSTKDVNASIESRTGFFVGPTVKLTLPVVGLGLDAAALYDQREGKASEGTESKTFKSQSIQIPINIRYGFGLGSLAELFFFAGPQFGFNVGGKESVEDIYLQAKSEWSLKSSNLSANAGLGITVLNHLQAKLNYNFALGKTGEFKVTDLTNNQERTYGSATFNSWQISLAYFF